MNKFTELNSYLTVLDPADQQALAQRFEALDSYLSNPATKISAAQQANEDLKGLGDKLAHKVVTQSATDFQENSQHSLRFLKSLLKC